MFSLFAPRTSSRRPRSATLRVEALEDILSLSALVTFSNLGNQLIQKIDQVQVQKANAKVEVDLSATSPGDESTAANAVKIDNQVEGGDQSQSASNTSSQSTSSSVNGGTGDALLAVPSDLTSTG